MSNNDEKITIPIDADTKKAIQHKAIDAGKSVAEIARLLFAAWLDDGNILKEETLTDTELYSLIELVYEHKHGGRWTKLLGKLGRMKDKATMDDARLDPRDAYMLDKVAKGELSTDWIEETDG